VVGLVLHLLTLHELSSALLAVVTDVEEDDSLDQLSRVLGETSEF